LTSGGWPKILESETLNRYLAHARSSNMTEHLFLGLAGMIVLGIAAQWLAWYIRVPSIFLLLLAGFAVGPISGLLQPQALLGDLLFPIVSLSVAIILFEGGLSLRTVVLQDIGRVLRNLITIGVVSTWAISAAAAYLLLDFNLALSVLVGAMLVVSGPTVVGPLLRHVRPIERLRSTLQWEGFLIDPIGVMVAVLAFEVILAGEMQPATSAVITVLVMAVVGSAIGYLTARGVVWLIQHRFIPDYLHSAVTLVVVIAAFAVANHLHDETGLFTVTVMGIVMAHQRNIIIRHIIEFKETLGVLLISSLFILLSPASSSATWPTSAGPVWLF
jgi:NhaP-type Na+/H+ or K+/H+ antiporter